MNKSKLNCSMLIDPKLLLGNYVRETITSYDVCNILPSSLEPLVKDKRETIYFIHGITSQKVQLDDNKGEVEEPIILSGNHQFCYSNFKGSEEFIFNVITTKVIYEFSKDMKNWYSLFKPLIAEMEDIKTALHYGKLFGEELLQDMHGPEYEGEGSQLVINGYKSYLEKIKQAMIYLGDEEI